ncbi:MAG: cupin domain-containing protein [Gammaproteobacteria bacterium]|nr:cupin domain-containing protein [Gammaproteobacteria bacterium]
MPCTFPGDISVETFLQEYWQKQPLLIRNAFPGIENPLTPDELAGLACEDEINARIVFERHEQGNWHVQHGPFDEQDFEELPENNWTLLVTDVEKHVPEARALIDHFRFIPDWRIDDLMVSFAPKGGSVGPHTDAYDVFLIQTHGQRRWMINSDYDDACLEGTELRILAHFSAAQEWVLEPGDMLYLPPNIAHHGVALNECMTCSVGFRAPATSNLVSEYAECIASGIEHSLRYEDPELVCQPNPAEIDTHALARVKAIVAEQLTVTDDSFLRWFGEYCSEPRSGMQNDMPQTLYTSCDEMISVLHKDRIIAQSPASKFLFVRTGADDALLFVDGINYPTSQAFAITLTERRDNPVHVLVDSLDSENDRQVLLELYNNGSLILQ